MTPEWLNRSLGQKARYAKAELRQMAEGAMRSVDAVLLGEHLIIRGVWWTRQEREVA